MRYAKHLDIRLILSFSAIVLFVGFFLGLSMRLTGYYPVAALEGVIDPHMYYVRQFVHSLPDDVQQAMQKDAKALGMDIYEYNLQMCTYSPYGWWGFLWR